MRFILIRRSRGIGLSAITGISPSKINRLPPERNIASVKNHQPILKISTRLDRYQMCIQVDVNLYCTASNPCDATFVESNVFEFLEKSNQLFE